MLFNSYVFILGFLPVSVFGYYLLSHLLGANASKIWLAASSFVFYGWWNPRFVILLVVSIAFNYLISWWIFASENYELRQKILLVFGIAANLAALAYYKYVFAIFTFFHSVGVLPSGIDRIVLPIGISFFSFTQIGYLVDCQEGLVEERGLVNYILFVTFFPHLIAGPILHHREIMPQFADKATYRLDEGKLTVGLTLFVFGLVKKVLFADTIAPWAEAGFSHVGQLDAIGAWSTILAYSMQLYFDFSGYSDMAVGLGSMFGVRLPINFNSPYKSSSIIMFWQRWHMTLTRYLTLLIYNPISLWITRYRMARGRPSGRKAVETFGGFSSLVLFPTFVTMLLAGIWHGAGFQFVVFGLLHASYLSINHAWRTFGPKQTKASPPSWLTQAWPVGLTYLAVLLAQVFFRAESVHDAVTLLGGAFGGHAANLPLPIMADSKLGHGGFIRDFMINHGLVYLAKAEAYRAVTQPLMYNIALVLALALIAWCTPNTYQILGDYSPGLQKVSAMKSKLLSWKPNLAWALIVGTGLFLAMTRLSHPGRFLYFQF